MTYDILMRRINPASRRNAPRASRYWTGWTFRVFAHSKA